MGKKTKSSNANGRLEEVIHQPTDNSHPIDDNSVIEGRVTTSTTDLTTISVDSSPPQSRVFNNRKRIAKITPRSSALHVSVKDPPQDAIDCHKTGQRVHLISELLDVLMKDVQRKATEKRSSADSISYSRKSTLTASSLISDGSVRDDEYDEYDGDVESLGDQDLISGVALAKLSLDAFQRYQSRSRTGSLINASGTLSEDSDRGKRFEKNILNVSAFNSGIPGSSLTPSEMDFKNKLVEMLNNEPQITQTPRIQPFPTKEGKKKLAISETDEDNVNQLLASGNVRVREKKEKKSQKCFIPQGSSYEDCGCIKRSEIPNVAVATQTPSPRAEYPLDRYLSEETRAALQGRPAVAAAATLEQLRAEAVATVRSAEESSERAEEVGRQAQRCLAAIREATGHFRDSARAPSILTGNDVTLTARTSSTTIPSSAPSRTSLSGQQMVPTKEMQSDGDILFDFNALWRNSKTLRRT